MSSNFDWFKSYRKITNAGHMTWYDFEVSEKITPSSTGKSIDEYQVIANAKGRYPNGREVSIIFKYRFYHANTSTPYGGSASEQRVNISLSVTDNKINRESESQNFLHKDYFAQAPGSAPPWLNNMYITLLEIVKSRKNQTNYIQQLDKAGMVILDTVLKGLP